MDREQEAGDPEYVDLVAKCIDGYTNEGPAAVERIFTAHPEKASRLRARLQHLDRLGLLGTPADHLPLWFGPYRVLRRLGRGGMSEVLLAHDPRMDREVALKTCHPSMSLEPRARERFQREVRSVAKLSHPAIVPVYDVGEADSGPYFTMEFVEGATLASVLTELRGHCDGASSEITGRVERIARHVCGVDPAEGEGQAWERSYVELIAHWAVELASALEHAHAAGVVHRDINPANIIVRANGRVQLLDFGLARLGDAPSLTRFGEFTGTPYYVSPEQLAGEVDGQDSSCDVYSMGVTLYELLTLRRPFEGTSTSEVLNRIQSDVPVSPRRIDARVPRDLELICLVAMERDRRRRYSSMSALANDLRRFLAFEPVQARPLGMIERTHRFVRRRPGAAALVFLAIVLLPVLTVAFQRVRGAVHGEEEAARLADAAAQRSAQLAQHMESFIGGLVDDAEFVAPGFPVNDLILRGLNRLPEANAVEDGDVRIALLEASGKTYARMGRHSRALGLLNRAVQDRSERNANDPHLPETLLHVSYAQLAAGESNEAHATAQTALGIIERIGLDAASTRRSLWLVQAEADQRLERSGQADIHLANAVATLPSPPGQLAELPEHLDVLERLGRIGISGENWDLASKALTRWLTATSRQAWVADPLRVNTVRSQLAVALRAMDDEEGAREQEARVELVRERLARWQSDAVDPPPLPFDVLHNSWRAEYTALFRDSWQHFIDGDVDAARDGFLRALDLRPNDPLAAFNLACVDARGSGRRDASIAWLERAVDWGFGLAPNQSAEVILSDMDLRSLHDDPRFSRLLERVRAVAAAGPWIDVQLQDDAPEARPLLVHLLPSDTPRGVQSAVGDAARALGWSTITTPTVSPSGAGNPGWLEPSSAYPSMARDLREWLARRLHDVLDGLAAAPAPVMLLAEGDAGPLGTSFALHHPGLVHGLILLDSYPGNDYRSLALRDAALAGVGVTLLDRPEVRIEWVVAGTTDAEWSAALAAWFDAFTLNSHTERLGPDRNLASVLERALVRARDSDATR